MIFVKGCLFIIIFSSIDLICNVASSDDAPPILCRSDDSMREYYNSNENANQAMKQFEVMTRRSISTRSTSQRYVIPVVFHVYGTDFAGHTVNDTTIYRALQKLNEDFQGLNNDFDSVHPDFHSIRSKLDVTFKLARKDPDGRSTTGIVYYPAKGGYGLHTANEEIKRDAWDNYKYCNVYIQTDLYNNGVLTNSGIAWYPDSEMSAASLARIVYNGRYLYGNTDENFASVLTHEFGHWLNLMHTFNDGCVNSAENQCDQTGDRICDTPQTIGNEGCAPKTNCAGKQINSENYMDYSGAYGCYKMFTAGQVARMEAALHHVARLPLWQPYNLVATGVADNDTANPCASSPCLNGGICLQFKDEYFCACKPGWNGPRCNASTATATPFLNSTTTTTTTVTTVSNSTSCSADSCLNGGKCFKMRDSFVCVCSAQYTGPRCEQLLSPLQPANNTTTLTCAQNPCQNGGTCYNASSGYFCYCGMNTTLTGRNCESRIIRRVEQFESCPLNCTPGECVRLQYDPLRYGCLCNGILKQTSCVNQTN